MTFKVLISLKDGLLETGIILPVIQTCIMLQEPCTPKVNAGFNDLSSLLI